MKEHYIFRTILLTIILSIITLLAIPILLLFIYFNNPHIYTKEIYYKQLNSSLYIQIDSYSDYFNTTINSYHKPNFFLDSNRDIYIEDPTNLFYAKTDSALILFTYTDTCKLPKNFNSKVKIMHIVTHEIDYDTIKAHYPEYEIHSVYQEFRDATK